MLTVRAPSPPPPPPRASLSARAAGVGGGKLPSLPPPLSKSRMTSGKEPVEVDRLFCSEKSAAETPENRLTLSPSPFYCLDGPSRLATRQRRSSFRRRQTKANSTKPKKTQRFTPAAVLPPPCARGSTAAGALVRPRPCPSHQNTGLWCELPRRPLECSHPRS